MTIVVDASVALKWVLDEPGSDAASTLQREELIAPDLWLVEVANALWRHVRSKQLETDDAVDRLAELRSAPVTSIAVEPHIERALKLATEIGHPIYDCLYLAVALHYGTHVVTADRRFADIGNRAGYTGRVRLLSAGATDPS